MSSQIESAMHGLRSGNERERDVAADDLGDVLKACNGTGAELQTILDVLGPALESETSELVIESILNAISNAKYRRALRLPLESVRKKLPFCTGYTRELAEDILQED